MKKTLLVAACSFALDATSQHLVLIPEGKFRGIDGRPFDAPHWNLTPASGQQIVALLNQRSIDMVMDYEHSTLKAIESGEPAPAAGWLKPVGFQYIEGVGLCSADFEWTEKAKGYIEAKEYKYISPVLFYNKAGEVLGLHSVALTNTPNLDQLPEARLAAAAQEFFAQNLTTQDSEMEDLLKELRWMLNLPLAATAEDIMAELGKLSQQIKEKTGVAVAANSQNLFDALSAIDQLKIAANSQMPDPSKFVPIAMYNEAKAQAAQVASNGQVKEIEDLITAACSDGRLTGDAATAWAKEFAQRDFAGFKAHIDGIPKIAALTQKQTATVDVGQVKQTQSAVDDIAANVESQLGL